MALGLIKPHQKRMHSSPAHLSSPVIQISRRGLTAHSRNDNIAQVTGSRGPQSLRQPNKQRQSGQWVQDGSVAIECQRSRNEMSHQEGRPPFPVERRPSSLVCAWFNPSLQKREGRSVWLEAPWGHGLEVLGRCLRGHLRRCKWSVDWRGGPLRARQRTNPGHG